MCEEQVERIEAWKAMTSRRKPALAIVRDETAADVIKLHSESDSAAARHHELLASIIRVLKACEERKDKTAGTLVKLC